MKLTITLSLVIQLISIYKYFKPHLEDWVIGYDKQKWVNKRDRVIIFLSVIYFIFSFLTIGYNLNTNSYISYFITVLIIAMTVVILLFHWSKFDIFQENQKTRVSKKDILIEKEFKLKKFSEEDLKIKIYECYSNDFSNDFYDFKKIFINGNSDGNKLNTVFKAPKSKRISYQKIFELMNECTENGILDLFRDNNKLLFQFIIKNFQMGGRDIKNDNLRAAVSKWVTKNR